MNELILINSLGLFVLALVCYTTSKTVLSAGLR